MAFVWGAGGAQLTPEQIASQRAVAEAMRLQGSDASPVKHWTQGAARVTQALLGGYEGYRADEAEKANRVADQQMIASLLGGQGGAAAPVASPTVAPDMPIAPVPRPQGVPMAGDPAAAIAAIESGGRYDIQGPVTRTGDRALGKYQVMAANVPQWTKAHLGQELTPEQFLADPKAQDAVFKGQFGQYQQKYGPEGAARAWFAGEGGMNDMGRKDQLGTSVADYAAKFNKGMGAPAAAPGAMAQAAPPAVAPTQTPASGLAGVNPALIQAITSPYASEGTKKIATLLLQQKMGEQKVNTIDLGNAVGVMDARGNVIRTIPKGEPNKGPEFGEIGTDPETGEKLMGWRDPRSQSVTPFKPPTTAQAAPSVIPPKPAGMDPKVWREGQSKKILEESLPPDDKMVSGLRKEIQDLPAYKNIAQAAPVYKSMTEAAGRDTRAADVNLIYGLAKIMDPGSVVRESEMTVAQAVATLPQQLKATIESQLSSTGRLTPEVREAIMQEAHGRMGAYSTEFGQVTDMFRGIAKRRRILEEDVIPNFGEFKPWERQKAPASPVTGKTKAGVTWSVK